MRPWCRTPSLLLVLGAISVSATALGAPDASDPTARPDERKPDDKKPAVPEKKRGLLPDLATAKLSWYLIPGASVAYQSAAVPIDKLVYGVGTARFGTIARVTPYEHWVVRAQLAVDASYIRSGIGGATSVASGTIVNNGETTTSLNTVIPSIIVDEATVAYEPTNWFGIRLGHMRIPFTLGHSVVVTGQMFPQRPTPTSTFMTGPDDGAMAVLTVLEDRLRASAGVFNGQSLGLESQGIRAVGPTWSVALSTRPLGALPVQEGAPKGDSFKFELGMAGLLRTGELYDLTGYGSTSFRDIRAEATARMALFGLFVQGEYLYRLQTDELSLRPSSAMGGYVQGSYYVPAGQVGFAPIARYGYTETDREFALRQSNTLEAGLAFYPVADLERPDDLRLIAHYAYELRRPFRETSHGAVLSLQIVW